MDCFAKNFSDSVESISEGMLISRFCKNLSPLVPQSPFGPGDDCAVIDKGKFFGKILCTSDAVILGRHFLADTPANLAGQKLLNRNISDIASMGGFPKFAMSSCIISPKISLKWLDLFCRGLREAAEVYGVNFIGGDVTRGADDFFSMHITLLGQAQKTMLRTGARAKDKIFVTGPLGASFESGRHLTFLPRVQEGEFLASLGIVTSCTDISDGIASDLRDLLGANLSAKIFADSIPIFDFPGNNLKKALCDGEDYELLFTVDSNSDIPAFCRAFERKFSYSPIFIGEIIGKDGGKIFVEQDTRVSELSSKGFSHF